MENENTKCRSHMAKYQTPFISWVKFLCNFDMGPASGCQSLIEVTPGLTSHTQIYFSIITAFYLLSRVLSAAGNDLYSAIIFRQNRSDAGKLNHFTCPYPLKTFVPVPKNLGIKAVLALQTLFYDVCKQCMEFKRPS